MVSIPPMQAAFLSVPSSNTTWEWSEDIDVARAEEAKKRAEDKLSQSGMDDKEVKLAEAKLHRALVRIGTVGK